MEVVEYKREENPSRRMWVYGSMKHFLSHEAYSLSHCQMRESGLATIVLTKDQKITLKGGLIKLFRDDRLDSYIPHPLYLNVPGNLLETFEAAVADFSKAIKEYGSNNYYIPVRIFANIG